MSRPKRLVVFFAGAIPVGLVAALLWPVGGYVTAIACLFVYQALVQPWAMTGKSLRSLAREPRDRE